MLGRTLRTLRPLRVLQTGASRTASLHPRPFTMSAFRLDDKKKSQPESNLLNDDMLARAGMNPDHVERPEGSAGEGESSQSESGEGETKKKWENTARKPRDESQILERRARRAWIFTGLAFASGALFLARPFDEDEKKAHPDIPPDWEQLGGLWSRLNARVMSTFDTFSAPVFEKLLPDALPPPYERPTLVVALDDLLVKSQWTREHGWRVAKRPGVDYFLGYLAQYYEVVIWSDKYQMMAADTVLKLDPLRAAVSYALFREATRFKDGKPIKDLNHLNRDLKKVVVVDVDKDAVPLQPENALLLPPWKGNADDVDLVRLIPLLEWIALQQLKDVRPVLKSYAKTPDILTEYERRDRIARDKWAQSHGGGRGGAASLLGMKSGMTGNLMPQDLARIESQKSYKRFKEYVEENGKKMLEQEKQVEKEVAAEHKMSLSQLLSGDGPSQEEVAASMLRKQAEIQKKEAEAGKAPK